MALLGSFVKQPGETLPVDISFSDVIGGRTTSSITPVATVPSGMSMASGQLSGEVFQIYVAGGSDGVTYRWTVVTTIVIGGKSTIVEDEFDVLVEAV